MQKFTYSLLLLFAFLPNVLNTYCSSTCIDYTGACFDDTPEGCWACATSFYNMKINSSLVDPCTKTSQTNILAKELSNSAMSLFGYTSSNPTPHTCTNYTFSGQYTASDYLSKNFTNIPLNHYAIVVRFNVGYMGFWDNTDYLRLALTDEKQILDYDYYYSCDFSENICDEVYNTTDCIRIQEYTLTHNTSFVHLNFSALINQTNATQMSWGIKELIVAAKECHGYCLTCYGGSSANCLSCADGYYLQGNVCRQKCDSGMYHVEGAKVCATACPSSYFGVIDGVTGIKSCMSCQQGCMVCSGANICQAWENQEAYQPDMWKDKMEFWILLIIIICAIVAFIIYLCVKKLTKPKSELEQKLNSGDQKVSGDKIQKSHQKHEADESITKQNDLRSEANLKMMSESLTDNIQTIPQGNLWFNELVQLEPSEVVKVKPSRRRKRGDQRDPSSIISDTLENVQVNGEL